MAVMTSAPGRRDVRAGRAPPDPRCRRAAGAVGSGGSAVGRRDSLMASGFSSAVRVSFARSWDVSCSVAEEVEDRDQVGALTTDCVVVVGAQAQGAVRRPGARHAGDDPHLLAVGVLRGEQLRGGRVVRDLVVDLGRQHEPLDDRGAAGDLSGHTIGVQRVLEHLAGRQLVLLDRA